MFGRGRRVERSRMGEPRMSKTSVEVFVAGIEEPLSVADPRGVEAISRPFRVDLVVDVPDLFEGI